MLFVCIVLSDCVNGRYTAQVTWLWEDVGCSTQAGYRKAYVPVSSCQLVIDVSGGNAQREISSSSHQCVPVIVAPVFS